MVLQAARTRPHRLVRNTSPAFKTSSSFQPVINSNSRITRSMAAAKQIFAPVSFLVQNDKSTNDNNFEQQFTKRESVYTPLYDSPELDDRGRSLSLVPAPIPAQLPAEAEQQYAVMKSTEEADKHMYEAEAKYALPPPRAASVICRFAGTLIWYVSSLLLFAFMVMSVTAYMKHIETYQQKADAAKMWYYKVCEPISVDAPVTLPDAIKQECASGLQDISNEQSRYLLALCGMCTSFVEYTVYTAIGVGFILVAGAALYFAQTTNRAAVNLMRNARRVDF